MSPREGEVTPGPIMDRGEAAKMFYFIANIHSRSGQSLKAWEKLEQRLSEGDIPCQIHMTRSAGHAVQLADQLSDRAVADYDCKGLRSTIVAVGGDGTFNEVINGMHDFDKVNLAIIPLGSGNDLGRGLGITNKDPLARLEEILANCHDDEASGDGCGRIRKMDLGRVELEDGNSRLFAISCGMGFDAAVCRGVDHMYMKGLLNKLHLGRLSYLVKTLQTILFQPLYRGKILCKREGRRTCLDTKDMIFVAAMNQAAEGGGVPMYPKADAFDGKLGICLADSLPRLLALFMLPGVMLRLHRFLPGVHLMEADSLQISMEDVLPVHSDGEDLGLHRRIKISCQPRKLRMFI